MYAPRAKSPHFPFDKGGEGDLKVLPVDRRVLEPPGRKGEKVAFLNVLPALDREKLGFNTIQGFAK